jgi:hypothetical protein
MLLANQNKEIMQAENKMCFDNFAPRGHEIFTEAGAQ